MLHFKLTSGRTSCSLLRHDDTSPWIFPFRNIKMHFQPGRQFNPGVTDIMYQLYIANKNYSSWSLRPWVLLRELGIAFNEQVVPFAEGSSWDAFRGFSPTGKVPALTDGETTVWDSLGIVEYLAERHDGVWPGDPQARAWA